MLPSCAMAHGERGSLSGRRVLVPRGEEQGTQTARELRARGAEPILAPVLAFGPPPDPGALERAVDAMDTYDIVAFTSANGVRSLFEALGKRGPDARALGSGRVAAVGPATAEALLERGVRADIVAGESRGEGLARAILATHPKRVLIAQALVAREALPDALRAAGVQVDVVAAYQTRPAELSIVDPLKADLLAGQMDAVLFTSSSTVTCLMDALGERAVDLLSGTVVACIGPVTAATARERGLRPDVIAAECTMADLLDALERHFAR
jgi:uroporphyrinogen III methyltransferase / synthase